MCSRARNKKNKRSREINEVLKFITGDRERTNLLKDPEQKALAYLVQRIPPWINSDMLTAIGLVGNIIVFLGFILATYLNIYYLLLGLPGFAISWYGDSLDGRLAYYRQNPRKRYGFTLDITIDWISIILIGFGYIVYVEGYWDLLGYGFVVLYGWEMIIALIRYKITGNYSIDCGKLGPTEARIIIAVILVLEVLLQGSIIISVSILVLVLFIVNILDTHRLLRIANKIDNKEKEKDSDTNGN